ncbi:hypothetical protein [Halopiger xanaduensis]|uniref:Uncharacterized protein n=1 Tax=Halopiger xanaduensis (strain DSM 18323 / JCM 14033 / SH-6) TaxID=797210 RepID=F8D542_HALXS|nr:hypothetical protein [Halopiger xanaduensis]AEH36394.1 hypothetical protein Halxa_1766 [Halopiger xanaduensis SH-6]
MIPSRLKRLTELRRALPLTAAGLFLLALALPVWRITFEAPQYVETLVVELYAYPRIGGDFGEVAALNKYVGFYYPDPVYVEPNYEVHEKAIDVPEWVLGPVAFIGLAGASAAVSVLPSGKLERGLVALLGGTVAIFGTMAAIIQYRLYQAGHTLDPAAPLNGVDGFTPPLLGNYAVANIDGNAWFGPGGYLLVVAVALLAVAVALRHSPATVGDAPSLVRGGWERLRDRIGRSDREDSSGDGRPTDERPTGEREQPGATRTSDGHSPRTDGGSRSDGPNDAGGTGGDPP